MFTQKRRHSDQWSSRAQRLSIEAVLFFGFLLLCAAFFTQWWTDFSDPLEKSDIMVILSGDVARPMYGAELYQQGYAPQVWIDKPLALRREEAVRALGIYIPREEEVGRAILMKMGVPKSAIHLFGNNINSTADEARALRQEPAARGKKILIVTNRFHARRSRFIFRRYNPGADIRVVGIPEDDRHWWRHKDRAHNIIMEMFKVAYYFGGFHFVDKP